MGQNLKYDTTKLLINTSFTSTVNRYDNLYKVHLQCSCLPTFLQTEIWSLNDNTTTDRRLHFGVSHNFRILDSPHLVNDEVDLKSTRVMTW